MITGRRPAVLPARKRLRQIFQRNAEGKVAGNIPATLARRYGVDALGHALAA
jgi:hypothetical protein